MKFYTDDFLSRDAPGGAMGVRYEIASFTRFPGMQPFGTYPIHIRREERPDDAPGRGGQRGGQDGGRDEGPGSHRCVWSRERAYHL
jgi:hypothetical protein